MGISIKTINWVFALTLVFISCSNSVLAQTITDLSVNKDSFSFGDELKIESRVINNLDDLIYLQYIITTNNGLSVSSAIEIDPNFFGNINVYETRINDDFQKGIYSVMVRLVDEMQNNVYDYESLNFTVEALAENIDITLLVCKNSDCKLKTKLFTQNENVYLDYESEAENPTVSATLIFPDKTTQQISLPSSIKATQIGTYELVATASKEGYKTVTKKTQFGVIEEGAYVGYADTCNPDGSCSSGENYEKCPTDCPSGGSDGFCDKVSDGKCDPDCKVNEDSDCLDEFVQSRIQQATTEGQTSSQQTAVEKKEYENYLIIYVSMLLLAVFIMVGVVLALKK